ncbi:MAG: hypothetical protein U9R50_07270 [Campylobacterota bacterium]|nr:hypothetical protein [Campylobacterota bacterium]
MNLSEHKLLKLCGYGFNAESLEHELRISQNYSQYNELLLALENLQTILAHSDFYLSLLSDRDMIKIKNDMLGEDEFLMLDAEIIVWANEHNIELEEGLDEICIIGFKKE